MHLRSVELQMPKRQEAVDFLKNPWGLVEVETRGSTTYLRGSDNFHYALAITEGAEKLVKSATLVGTMDEVKASFERVKAQGLKHSAWVNEFNEPGHGAGFTFTGLEGEPFRVICEKDAPPAVLASDGTHPLRVAHVVFNTSQREAASQLLIDVLGFKVSDRTKVMNFLRCDELHHVVAYADSDKATLNHIAFEMLDMDNMFTGMGRMKDNGFETVWGPGRHGPGDNAFAYYIGPFGACIEFTSEIERVDDTYVTGTPEDWKWPPKRMDHWGIAVRDDAKLMDSSAVFHFESVAAH
jgi:catechol 2,3-dioxygenase-like lactoylglutathione lyase family enzyme